MNPYRSHGDDLADVVRSLRIAIALNERVGELVKPTQFTSDEKLANSLGELRQMYPEIWSNLDDARAGLARRGIVVAAYDRLRASDAARSGGVLDVDITGQRGISHYRKSATLNVEGHRAATEACNVLRAAMPTVDWEALDRADAEQLAAMGSLGPALWKKIVFFTIMLAIAALGVVGLVYFRIGVRTR